MIASGAPLWFSPEPSLAAESKQERPRFVIERFEGPGDRIARTGAVRALDNTPKVDLLPVSAIEKSGVSPSGSAKSYARLARKLNLSAIVSGSVEQKGPKSFALTVEIRSGHTGEVVETLEFKSPWVYGLRDALAKKLRQRLTAILSKVEAPGAEKPAPVVPVELAEEPAPKPVPKAPEAESSEPEEDESKQADKQTEASQAVSPVELLFGGEFMTRNFKYSGAIRGALRANRLNGAFGYHTQVTWFPAAHFTQTGGANLGLSARLRHMMGVQSRTGQVPLATAQDEYAFGAHYRFPLGDHQLMLGLLYGRHQFTVEDTFVPDVDYQYMAAEFASRFQFGWFVMHATLGFRQLLSAGEIASEAWFPRVGGFGFNGVGLFGVELTPGFDVLLGADFTQYSLALNSDPNAMNLNGVADGATDRQISGLLLVSLRWPGG